MKLSSFLKLFRFSPEDRFTTFAAIFCATLLVALGARIMWITEHPAPHQHQTGAATTP